MFELLQQQVFNLHPRRRVFHISLHFMEWKHPALISLATSDDAEHEPAALHIQRRRDQRCIARALIATVVFRQLLDCGRIDTFTGRAIERQTDYDYLQPCSPDKCRVNLWDL